MTILLSKVRVVPHALVVASATAVLMVFTLVVVPVLAASPVPVEATSTPAPTPSPTPTSGRKILFSGCPIKPQTPDLSYCDDWAIYQLNGDGSALRKLSQWGGDFPKFLTLSPDGRRLFFTTWGEGPGRPKPHLLDLTSLKASDLASDIHSCQWVTNNTAICDIWTGETATTGLYLIDFGTGNREKVLTGLGVTAFIQTFSVSPNGQQLLLVAQFLEGYPQKPKIIVTRVTISGAERTDLLTIPDCPCAHLPDVAWSPSGQWAVIQAEARVGFASFWIGEMQTSDLRKVAELSGIVNVLGWSPDEHDVLAYACNGDSADRFGRIAAISRDATGVRTIATLQGADGKLTNACGQGRLSQDQQSFLFWFIEPAAPPGQWGLYVTNSTLSQLRSILSGYHIADAIWFRPKVYLTQLGR